jgi:hypothetical protein
VYRLVRPDEYRLMLSGNFTPKKHVRFKLWNRPIDNFG